MKLVAGERPTVATKCMGRPAEFSGLVVIVVVVTIMVVIVVAVVMSPAAALCFFEFLAALVGLTTVLAVTLDGLAQFLLGLMNAPFAFVVAIGAGWHR
jgi:hypothetical protein